ncbi:MAG: NAD(P)H-hydrate dehydratase [Coriobacteriia bacterium]|nr:NAD(P)H-hydrate dehydratase [Coriobacteriia bacterium]
MDNDQLAALLPPIAPNAHKYQRGSLLVMGGSKRYVGAAVLAAQAAARTGAGYVSLAVPDGVEARAQAHLLTVPVIGLPASAAGDGQSAAFGQSASAAGSGQPPSAANSNQQLAASNGQQPSAAAGFPPQALETLIAQLKHVDAMLYGPGVLEGQGNQQLLIDCLAAADLPLVLDAGALPLLGQWLQAQRAQPEPQAQGHEPQSPPPVPPAPPASLALRPSPGSAWTVILTPHAGELAVLLRASGCADAAALAKALQAIVVLKGPETVVYHQDGQERSRSGTVGLAKAGSGDVLAGIIASLLAQGATPGQAAMAGVELHGRAGCQAMAKKSLRAMIARDIIEAIPDVLKLVEGV